MAKKHKGQQPTDKIVFQQGRRLFRSKAWLSIKSSAALKVYCEFQNRASKKKVRLPGSTSSEWVITNNGRIIFKSSEAIDLGICKSESTFTASIDILVDTGLIDIAHQGSGVAGDCSLYFISDRWRWYRTESFEEQHRDKSTHGFGFPSLEKVDGKWKRKKKAKKKRKTKQKKSSNRKGSTPGKH